MDRHKDWAVIVCLVGGGQEINTGEAGIDAWLDAVNRRFPHWHIYISARLTDSEYAAGNASGDRAASAHERTSMIRCILPSRCDRFVRRMSQPSSRRCSIANWTQAQEAFAELLRRYPIVLTRDLNRAKQWIRDQARGTERFGLVASSKAMRLKPHAIDIRVSVDPVH